MTAIAPIHSDIVHVSGLSDATKPERVHDGLPSFGAVLEGVVASTNESAKFAGDLSEAFAAGARDDIHGTMIALGKADVELRFVGTVRNKVIDAFYELWRMQL
ncbi:MAG TPA: flagellar hook-basal body complex protein FliE [Polyangiaceae bacterium]